VQFCTILVSVFIATSVFALPNQESRLYTFPPVFDYRSDPAIDYTSINIAGPIFKYEQKGSELSRAMRPLFFYTTDQDRGATQLDILYPFFNYKHDTEIVSYRFLFLFHYYSNLNESFHQREFSLFPFLLYKNKDDRPFQYALFPFTGHLYNFFGRDEVSYFLFPLYSHTTRGGTYVDNYLWPFFARISGDTPQESGLKIWPLYGHSENPGVYQKTMVLWPFWTSEDLQQDSDNPTSHRYLFPFYLYSEAPAESRRIIIWPFFSYFDNRKNGYTEWNFPWPLFSYVKGEHRYGYKALPLISDMTTNSKRTRNYLWPILRIEDQQFSTLSQKRTRLLFFLYTDLIEKERGTDQTSLHRKLLWPLFGYRQENDVSHFYTLALLEPIFQHSDGITRNWSPLWRLYQRKWDKQGNSVSTLLWNVFWHERSPKGVAWELFPIFSYRHNPERVREWSFLKGLIRVENNNEKQRLHLLYLPWGIPLGTSEL